MAILISYKVDFKAKQFARLREGHSVMIKWLIQQKDMFILNMHAPMNTAEAYEAKTNLTKNSKEQ